LLLEDLDRGGAEKLDEAGEERAEATCVEDGVEQGKGVVMADVCAACLRVCTSCPLRARFWSSRMTSWALATFWRKQKKKGRTRQKKKKKIKRSDFFFSFFLIFTQGTNLVQFGAFQGGQRSSFSCRDVNVCRADFGDNALIPFPVDPASLHCHVLCYFPRAGKWLFASAWCHLLEAAMNFLDAVLIICDEVIHGVKCESE